MTRFKETLIYCLIDPITMQVMYIGKTTCLRKRLRSHFSLAVNKRYKGVKGDWIRYLAWFNLRPEVEVLTIIPTEQATSWEYFYCKLFRACPLTNTGFIMKETFQIELFK